MLLAIGKPLSHTLLAHAHWTAQQRKMSKSIGNVADPFDAMELWGVDPVRFYMARVGGRFKDDVGKTDLLIHPRIREIFLFISKTGLLNNSGSTKTRFVVCSGISSCASRPKPSKSV